MVEYHIAARLSASLLLSNSTSKRLYLSCKLHNYNYWKNSRTIIEHQSFESLRSVSLLNESSSAANKRDFSIGISDIQGLRSSNSFDRIRMERKSRPCLSFQQIKLIITDNKLELLGRSDSGQQEYVSFMHEVVKKEWVTVADYILHSKFDLPYSVAADSIDCHDTNSNSKKMAVLPSEEDRKPTTKLLLNDFPYNFEADVEHFILWKLFAPLTDAEIYECIETFRRNECVLDATYYVNPTHLKSITEIEHAHIILHKKK